MTGAVLSYSESPDLAGEVAAAGAEVAKLLGTEAVALELDEVSAGLRYREQGRPGQGREAPRGDR